MSSLPRGLANRVGEALRLIEGWARARKKTLVLAKSNADGSCSAALIAKLLLRYGCPFEARALSLDELVAPKTWRADNVILLDLPLPSGLESEGTWLHVAHLPSLPQPSNVVELNPALAGLDGMLEACTTSLTFLLLREAGEVDEACLLLLCMGIQGEGQVKPPPVVVKGLNHACLSPFMEEGAVEAGRSLSLLSSKIPLASSIAATLDPPLKRIMGREEEARRLLDGAGLGEAASKPLSELGGELRGRLIQALFKEALSSGLDVQTAERLMTAALKVRVGGTLEDAAELSRIVDACVKAGKLALSIQPFLKAPPSTFSWEGLEAALLYSISVASRVSSLSRQLEGLKGAAKLEVEPELKRSTLDAALALASLYPPRSVEVLCRVGELVKVSAAAAKREASWGEGLLKGLGSVIEAYGGVAEAGRGWGELAAPSKALNELEKLWGATEVEGKSQADDRARLR